MHNITKHQDRRRMVQLREERRVQRSLTERLVRSRLQWAGHVERMADDILPKRAAELREQGRRRRGRTRLIWEDCVKRDVRNLTPDKGKQRKREREDEFYLKKYCVCTKITDQCPLIISIRYNNF